MLFFGCEDTILKTRCQGFQGIINAIKLFEAKQVGAIWDFEHENGLLYKNSQSLIGIRFNPFNVFQGKTDNSCF